MLHFSDSQLAAIKFQKFVYSVDGLIFCPELLNRFTEQLRLQELQELRRSLTVCDI